MIRIALFLCLLSLTACTQHAYRPSAEVTFSGHYLLFKGEKFTGMLEESFPQVETVRKTKYKNGLRDGVEEEHKRSGQLVARREFRKGKKHGLHQGWFEDGKRRFHHEFRNDKLIGDAWEWYPSGQLSMLARFVDGNVVGKKMWRESGQIYMNYVFSKDRFAGLPGSKLCYQVREDSSVAGL